MHLLPVPAQSEQGVVFEGVNSPTADAAGFVILGSPTSSGLNTTGFWVGEMQGSSEKLFQTQGWNLCINSLSLPNTPIYGCYKCLFTQLPL